MDIANIFKDIHGALDIDSLIPLKNCIGSVNEEYPSKEEFNEIISDLGVDESHVFFDPNSFLNRIIYWNECNYFPLHGFTMESIKLMDVKKRIHKRNNHFEELKKENDYDSIFMFMDKKLIIPMYKKLFDIIPMEQRYEIFVALHVRSEYGFEIFTSDFLKKVFALRIISPEYQKRMKELREKISNPKKFRIYHGHNKKHDPKDEYSWTLKKNTAFFFANRFNKAFDYEGKITQKYIGIEDVIDFFPDRGEDEIILLTDHLK